MSNPACAYCVKLTGRQSNPDFVTDIADFALFLDKDEMALQMIRKDCNAPVHTEFDDLGRIEKALEGCLAEAPLRSIEVRTTFAENGHQLVSMVPHALGTSLLYDQTLERDMLEVPEKLRTKLRCVPA